jgi:glycosyltransferase involved in cell wall biosynthesis
MNNARALESPRQQGNPARGDVQSTLPAARAAEVALLTGGADKPYALGLAETLVAQGVFLDFIGSDEIDGPQLHNTPQVNFLNLRGDQSTGASRPAKALRVLKYYVKLLSYAAGAKPAVFHILWNNKFEYFDRTLLMLYYKLLGKRIVLTAHNVNAGKRDLNDSFLNRLTLRIQYRMAEHIFVHAETMKQELLADFGVRGERVSVIPFGINNTLPNTGLSTRDAKRKLGIDAGRKTLLFFGNIAPYKGLDLLIAALAGISKRGEDYQLVIAGRPKGCEPYWRQVREQIEQASLSRQVIERIIYIPDEDVEIYFKAADVLLLPYNHVFQSGVLFLGYSFGLPVIATDVGCMKDEIAEGKTGFVCRAKDAEDLGRVIEKYFSSALYQNLEARRPEIQAYANERYSWTTVGEITRRVYGTFAAKPCSGHCSCHS